MPPLTKGFSVGRTPRVPDIGSDTRFIYRWRAASIGVYVNDPLQGFTLTKGWEVVTDVPQDDNSALHVSVERKTHLLIL